ncbi:hypothetical protein SMICM17S_01929 [Streptomyces microflavus]
MEQITMRSRPRVPAITCGSGATSTRLDRHLAVLGGPVVPQRESAEATLLMRELTSRDAAHTRRSRRPGRLLAAAATAALALGSRRSAARTGPAHRSEAAHPSPPPGAAPILLIHDPRARPAPRRLHAAPGTAPRRLPPRPGDPASTPAPPARAAHAARRADRVPGWGRWRRAAGTAAGSGPRARRGSARREAGGSPTAWARWPGARNRCSTGRAAARRRPATAPGGPRRSAGRRRAATARRRGRAGSPYGPRQAPGSPPKRPVAGGPAAPRGDRGVGRTGAARAGTAAPTRRPRRRPAAPSGRGARWDRGPSTQESPVLSGRTDHGISSSSGKDFPSSPDPAAAVLRAATEPSSPVRSPPALSAMTRSHRNGGGRRPVVGVPAGVLVGLHRHREREPGRPGSGSWATSTTRPSSSYVTPV